MIVDGIGRKLVKLIFALVLCLLVITLYCDVRDKKYAESSYNTEQVTSYVAVDKNGNTVKVKDDEKNIINGTTVPDWKKELEK